MSVDEDGGPVYPVDGPNGDHPGISLRDYLASQAMTAHIKREGMTCRDKEQVARMSYDLADAMLNARERT